jgi:hypothetical protein
MPFPSYHRALLGAVAVFAVLMPAEADAKACPHPFNPWCCPAPCPVVDETKISKWDETAKSTRTSIDLKTRLAETLQVTRHIIGVPTSRRAATHLAATSALAASNEAVRTGIFPAINNALVANDSGITGRGIDANTQAAITRNITAITATQANGLVAGMTRAAPLSLDPSGAVPLHIQSSIAPALGPAIANAVNFAVSAYGSGGMTGMYGGYANNKAYIAHAIATAVSLRITNLIENSIRDAFPAYSFAAPTPFPSAGTFSLPPSVQQQYVATQETFLETKGNTPDIAVKRDTTRAQLARLHAVEALAHAHAVRAGLHTELAKSAQFERALLSDADLRSAIQTRTDLLAEVAAAYARFEETFAAYAHIKATDQAGSFKSRSTDINLPISAIAVPQPDAMIRNGVAVPTLAETNAATRAADLHNARVSAQGHADSAAIFSEVQATHKASLQNERSAYDAGAAAIAPLYENESQAFAAIAYRLQQLDGTEFWDTSGRDASANLAVQTVLSEISSNPSQFGKVRAAQTPEQPIDLSTAPQAFRTWLFASKQERYWRNGAADAQLAHEQATYEAAHAARNSGTNDLGPGARAQSERLTGDAARALQHRPTDDPLKRSIDEVRSDPNATSYVSRPTL